jgi:predicted DNA-binding transcriptional regulator AlpA
MQHLQAVGGDAGIQSGAPAAASGASPSHVSNHSAARPRVLLNFSQLVAKLNVSERKARQIIAEPWMCDPVELGPRALRWVESEVDEALASRAPRRAEPHPEPAHLTRAKVERLKRGSAPAAGAVATA